MIKGGYKTSESYNLVGERFGAWKVIEKCDSNGHNIRWKCICDCGTERLHITSVLIAGKTRGCIKCSWNRGNHKPREMICGEISLEHWNNISRTPLGLRNKKTKKREFNITPEYAWELFLKQNRKCALSGVELVFNYRSRRGKENTASLDRIDSTKDYVVGNVQWVHKHINKIKTDFEQQYFIKLCTNVANYMKGQSDEKDSRI